MLTQQEQLQELKNNIKPKNCKNCNLEFTPKHATRGSEQLYCSKKCGQIIQKKRRDEKIIYELKTKMENENVQQQKQPGQQPGATNEIRNLGQRTMDGVSSDRWNNPYDVMANLEKLYDTKNENQFLKFKIETLEKENTELKTEIFELENELEFSELEENEGGFLGGIVEQFKKDPTTTINFAKTMLDSYFKK